ncbi:hypothetical protein EYF80_034678 [Liparis tanakae]|uniref:Uncharacterized protein n=1 Tax=Liparis tanakae TaxID=230148 RepID=A0A4Z2GQT9_9TELE|nr:hypothetical protein EYF80_034678 [Liparis tanakae]
MSSRELPVALLLLRNASLEDGASDENTSSRASGRDVQSADQSVSGEELLAAVDLVHTYGEARLTATQNAQDQSIRAPKRSQAGVSLCVSTLFTRRNPTVPSVNKAVVGFDGAHIHHILSLAEALFSFTASLLRVILLRREIGNKEAGRQRALRSGAVGTPAACGGAFSSPQGRVFCHDDPDLLQEADSLTVSYAGGK